MEKTMRKTAGESIKEVKAAVGDAEINQLLKEGWQVYGVPTIPVGQMRFYWMMVKRDTDI